MPDSSQSDNQPPSSTESLHSKAPRMRQLQQWYHQQTKLTKFGLGCGVLFVVLALCSCMGEIAIASRAVSNTNVQATTPTHRILAITPTTPSSPANAPTSVPTTLPPASPSRVPTVTATSTHAVAYLGSNVSAFLALYGPHGDTSLKGSINWTLSKTEWVAITFDTTHRYVYDVSHYFYPASQMDNHQQDNVSFKVARQTCSRFMPPDSVLVSINKNKPDPNLADGVQYIFKSKWLANQVDASLFYFDEGTGTMNDKYNTPVDFGTYTLFYIGTEQSGYEMCFLTTGINWPY